MAEMIRVRRLTANTLVLGTTTISSAPTGTSINIDDPAIKKDMITKIGSYVTVGNDFDPNSPDLLLANSRCGSDSSGATLTALKPYLFPIEPPNVRLFQWSGILSTITGTASGSYGFAVYSYEYTANAAFTAALIAKTATIDSSISGSARASVVNGPAALNFSTTKYMLGVIASSGSSTIPIKAIGDKTGTIVFSATRANTSDWPASFSNSDVVSSGNVFYGALLSSKGFYYI